MPSLRQFEYLVALSQELHFRRAAEKMNVTQPTLSVQLQHLEKDLGAALIERGHSGVMLTPLGREIAARAMEVLRGVRDIQDLAHISANGFEGTIRLGVPPTLGPYLLPHIVPKLHAEYPSMNLYVREEKPVLLAQQLLSGKHDLAIVPMPINSSDLVVQKLFEEPLRLVCAPDHQLASKKVVTKNDLKSERVLAMESGHHLHDQVVRLCDVFGASLLRDYEGTSLDTLRLMVGMGVGIAFLPALYIRSEIGTRDEITVLDFNISNIRRSIALAWRQSSVHSSLFNEIAELIRSIAKEDLPELLATTG
ncbi:MAG: hydrogen peroxide-inducible genes activator [Rhizobiaceae bacterium]